MNFLVSILGGFLGIILAIAIIVFIIYKKMTASFGKENVNALMNAMANTASYEQEEYNREKNVIGMTKLLEPEILRDFTEFNKDLLFSKCENNIRKILNSIETKNKSILNDDEFIYMKEEISEKIIDMESNNIYEKYDNIEFNRSAISAYNKNDGKATIKLSTTLSYYYTTNRKDKKSFSNIKKQTRYTSEYVYVYDEGKFEKNQRSFSVHCPNCGAPLIGLEEQYCQYCGNKIEKINLKVWKMSSCKEDYK